MFRSCQLEIDIELGKEGYYRKLKLGSSRKENEMGLSMCLAVIAQGFFLQELLINFNYFNVRAQL